MPVITERQNSPPESSNTSEKLSNPLTKKINKLLEIRLESDKDTLDALKELSTFFPENNLRTRKNLRGMIERRSLTINQDFLTEFSKVRSALDGIYNDVKGMDSLCSDMTRRLQATKVKTKHLIEETNKLQSESQSLAMREEVCGAFLHTFQLTAEESEALRTGDVTPRYFQALSHAQRIHRDCRLLLLQTGRQTAGLVIMEQMAMYQVAGLERLYRWAQGAARTPDALEVQPLLVQAMECLQDRPILFKYVLEEYGTARRQALVRAFIDALTCGGRGGTPRPIELHAHDPPRYVGDMLAWLHQATPSERDALVALLKSCTKVDVTIHMEECLSHITEGVCRPLKSRIEQIIVSDPGAVILYRLTNLLRFYIGTIKQVVPQGSLLSSLEELQQLCYKMAISALQTQVSRLCERVETPGGLLTPPQGVGQCLHLVRDVLQGDAILDDRQQDLVQIVGCIVEPLVQAVTESAAPLGPIEMAVYLLNCLHQTWATLALYQFTEPHLERLCAQMDAQLDALTSEQASALVQRLGLSGIYSTLQAHAKSQPSDSPLSLQHGMEPDSIAHFLTKLNTYLGSPDDMTLHQVGLLLSSSHRKTVTGRSAEVVSAIYRQLYEAVHLPENKYDKPEPLMPRTPEQIDKLLRGH